ncbi:hypothetical protein [Thiolapillus sp.]
MLTRLTVFSVSILLLSSTANAQRIHSASPGHLQEATLISNPCPTFSWGQVKNADGYELVVFSVLDTVQSGRNAFEEYAEQQEPIVQTVIPTKAFSWTPANEQCLGDGARYVWFVRGTGEEASAEWSPGRYFTLDIHNGELAETIRQEVDLQLRRSDTWQQLVQQMAQTQASGIKPVRQVHQDTRERFAADNSRGAAGRTMVKDAGGTLGLSPQALPVTTFPDPAAFRISSPNGVLFDDPSYSLFSPVGGSGGIPAEGGGARMMWYPARAAFRAGSVSGGQWDGDRVLSGSLAFTDGSVEVSGTGTAFKSELAVGDRIVLEANIFFGGVVATIASDTKLTLFSAVSQTLSGPVSRIRIGDGSVAMGSSPIAGGDASIATGFRTIASGTVSTAMGGDTLASGNASTALGRNTVASGDASTAMGKRTVASNDAETVVGKYNTTANGRLFTVGNGTSASNSDAFVVQTDADTAIGLSDPLTRLHVVDIINSDSASPRNYVGLIENIATGTSADVLALKIGTTSDPQTQANFVGFFNGNNTLVGEIQGNNSGGVSYASTGGDYAEYLPLQDPAEALDAGDIVGVYAGAISRDTTASAQLMVITDRAAVVGNMPRGDARSQAHRAVAFVGQLPVKVRGKVRAGDVIVASGRSDGTGRAVKIAELAALHDAKIVGRAWSASEDPGLKKVQVAVGLDHTDMAISQIKHLQDAYLWQQQEIAMLRMELDQYKQLASEIERLKGLLQPQLLVNKQ